MLEKVIKTDVLVIGGGAAGFFAAVNIAELNPKLSILIVEKSSQPLAKVLVSGGGRCNLTHACFDPAQLVQHYPRGGAALRGPFTRFQPNDTMAWFEAHDIQLKTEPDGRVFPVSNSSQTIVECLLSAANQAGVKLYTKTSAESLLHSNQTEAHFHVCLRNIQGIQDLSARNVLLATGGNHAGLQLAAGLGHRLVPPIPSLFSFTIPDSRLEGLAGLSVPHARLKLLDENGKLPRLPGLEQEGALLITHWGLSGPVVLRLSSWAARWLHEQHYRSRLIVNWLGLPIESTLQKLRQERLSSPGRKVEAHSPFSELPLRLWKQLCTAAEVRTGQNWADLSKAQLDRLSGELCEGCYQVQGKGQFKDEFVTCGGVDLDQVDFHTMQSRLVPGLFFAGEVLDIDGLTGGFNFQSAWTTGWLAAQGVLVAEGGCF